MNTGDDLDESILAFKIAKAILKLDLRKILSRCCYFSRRGI